VEFAVGGIGRAGDALEEGAPGLGGAAPIPAGGERKREEFLAEALITDLSGEGGIGGSGRVGAVQVAAPLIGGRGGAEQGGSAGGIGKGQPVGQHG